MHPIFKKQTYKQLKDCREVMLSTQKNDEQKVSEFSQLIVKWLVLLNLCLNSTSSMFLFNAFAPIWPRVANYYQTTDYTLNWLSNWYYLGPIVFTPIMNPFILKHFGISQIMSNLTTMGGLWILYFVKESFALAFLGFTFIGVGQGLYFHVPLYLSKLWFEPNQRIKTTFIGQYSCNIGLFLGYLYSLLAFDEEVDDAEFIKQYENMLFVNALFSTITFPLCFFALKSDAQQKEIVQIRDNIWTSFKKICKSSESVFDFLSIAAVLGFSYCFPYLIQIQQLLANQTNFEFICVSFSFQAGTVFISSFCTYYLQKQANQGLQLQYDKYIKGLLRLGFIFLTIQILFFEDMHYSLLSISTFMVGGGFGGLLSLLLESLMEKHFPVQELAIASFVEISACIFALIITMSSISEIFFTYGMHIFSFVIIPAFCYMSAFYKTDFQRFEYEG